MTGMMLQPPHVYGLFFLCWLIVSTVVPACNASDLDPDLVRPLPCEPGERDPMYGGRIPLAVTIRVYVTASKKALSFQKLLVIREQLSRTIAFPRTPIQGCELTIKFLGQRGDVDDYLLIMDLRNSTNSLSVTEPRREALEKGGFYYWHPSFDGREKTVLRGSFFDVTFEPYPSGKYTDMIDWRPLSAEELRATMEKLKVGGKETWDAFYLLAGQGKDAIEVLIESSSDSVPMADAEWTLGLHCGRLIDPPVGVFQLYIVDVILRKQDFHSWAVIVPDDFPKGLDMTGLDIGTSEAVHKRAVKLYEEWWEQVKHLDLDEIRRTVRPLEGSGLRWVDDYEEGGLLRQPNRNGNAGVEEDLNSEKDDVRKEDDKK